MTFVCVLMLHSCAFLWQSLSLISSISIEVIDSFFHGLNMFSKLHQRSLFHLYFLCMKKTSPRKRLTWSKIQFMAGGADRPSFGVHKRTQVHSFGLLQSTWQWKIFQLGSHLFRRVQGRQSVQTVHFLQYVRFGTLLQPLETFPPQPPLLHLRLSVSNEFLYI